MTTLGYEHGREAIDGERKPILYDAKGRPLVNAVGFQRRVEKPRAEGAPS